MTGDGGPFQPFEVPTDPFLERLPEDPVWRQAALDVVSAFDRGDIISHEWIDAHLHVTPRTGLMTAQQHTDIQLERVKKVEALKAVLIYEHARLLMPVTGQGYRIVPSNQQTMVAQRRLKKGIIKKLKQAHAAIHNVEKSLLTMRELQENEAAVMKLSWLASMSKKQLEHEDPPTGACE